MDLVAGGFILRLACWVWREIRAHGMATRLCPECPSLAPPSQWQRRLTESLVASTTSALTILFPPSLRISHFSLTSPFLPFVSRMQCLLLYAVTWTVSCGVSTHPRAENPRWTHVSRQPPKSRCSLSSQVIVFSRYLHLTTRFQVD